MYLLTREEKNILRTFDFELSAWYILESGNIRILNAFLLGPASRTLTTAKLSSSYRPWNLYRTGPRLS